MGVKIFDNLSLDEFYEHILSKEGKMSVEKYYLSKNYKDIKVEDYKTEGHVESYTIN